jgi:hypothetical protein
MSVWISDMEKGTHPYVAKHVSCARKYTPGQADALPHAYSRDKNWRADTFGNCDYTVITVAGKRDVYFSQVAAL